MKNPTPKWFPKYLSDSHEVVEILEVREEVNQDRVAVIGQTTNGVRLEYDCMGKTIDRMLSKYDLTEAIRQKAY